jgi:hypothetical protein
MKKTCWYLIVLFSPITLGAFPFIYFQHLKIQDVIQIYDIRYAFPLFCLIWLYVWDYFNKKGWNDL